MMSRFQEWVFILVLILATSFVLYRNRGKKKWDPRNSFQGPGQFFDTKTYTGNMRFMVFACLWIFGGRHIDEIGQWLWRQFGKELIVSPEKAAWHAHVATVMGMVGLVVSILNIQLIYNDRKRKKEHGIEPMTKGTTKGKGGRGEKV